MMMTRYDNSKDASLFIGQIVHWFPDGDVGQQPHAAVVTKINAHSIKVTIWSPSFKDGLLRDAVQHMSDPNLKNEFNKKEGGWEHTPQTKMMAGFFGDDLKRVMPPSKK